MGKKITVKRKNVTFVMDYDAVGDILKGDKIEPILEETAHRVAGNAGGNYDVTIGMRSFPEADRKAAYVSPADDETLHDVYKHNTLLKGLHK